MKTLILFPHQLFEQVLTEFEPTTTEIILHEHPLFFTAYRFHKTKLWFHRASMKVAQNEFESKGFNVRYCDYTTSLKEVFETSHNEIIIFDPLDSWLFKNIKQEEQACSKTVTLLENPQFLLTREECVQYVQKAEKSKSKTKSLRMQYFYQFMRSKTGLLMEEGEPIGGVYSFDTENRKPYKGAEPLPKPYRETTDKANKEVEKISQQARMWVMKNFPDNPGEVCCNYPISWHDAKLRCEQFVSERLDLFGPYEDAMVSSESELFHSSLSMLLNVGLLLPPLVIKQVIDAYHRNSVSLQSTEGFIRQVIGWREYMRLLYITREQTMRSAVNGAVGRTSWLSEDWYGKGETGIIPLDDVITKLLATGYNHHIERLMVIGNMMQLLEINIHEVYSWFMMHYIDAYDWVMLGNIVAMSQYLSPEFTTKPYISGSRYILSMSNYKKGDWTNKWDALYWDAIARHYNEYKTNPRMSMMTTMYNNFSKEKQEELAHTAKLAKQELTSKKALYNFELTYEQVIAPKTT